jgi:hypothetical protein
MAMEIWDLWYPNAAAQGLSFARGRMESTDIVWVHSAPDSIRVEVRDDDGRLLASGDQLGATTPDLPMTRLQREGSRIMRVDTWPSDADKGRTVILPGGEVGVLLSWWNSDDEQEWRWQIEFYNHR